MILFGLLVAGLSAAFGQGVATPRGRAQSDRVIVRAVPPSDHLSRSKDQVDVAIEVENASNLAAFDFILTVDPRLLRVISVQKTPFLTQTGREAVCGQPVIQDGSARLACVTLREAPPGVDGSGTIATVSIQPLETGKASLSLSNVRLLHPDGSELPSTATNGELTIASGGFWTRTRVLLLASGGVLLVCIALAIAWRVRLRRRRPTANGDPGAPTAPGVDERRE
jgi:hypothetical protein